MKLEAQVINVRERAGNTNGRAWSFQIVDAIVQMPGNPQDGGGPRICELMVDSKHKVASGGRYSVEFAPEITKEKKIGFRVVAVHAGTAQVSKVA
jgi:hypothetical protein